jgi:uncharacterized protein
MTNRLIVLLLMAVGAAQAAAPPSPPLCSDAWYRMIDAKVPSGDGQGHGPDVGSEEWKSVIEFKLGIRGKPNVPPRDSEGWCRYIGQQVAARGPASNRVGNAPAAATTQRPSFACDKVRPGSIEAMVCADKELSALDRKLSAVYAAASKKATNEHPPRLKAEQRGWIKGRNDCWKSEDKRECARTEYVRRIAELQARYRLVPGKGPIYYACDGNPANEVVATFFETEPPTLVAERGDSVSLMYLQPSGSGAKYQGRNEALWEHQGEAVITWGYGAPEMRCTKKP